MEPKAAYENVKATYDEANNCWRLNGVKRFITNGDANLHLVLARSEEGTHDGRVYRMWNRRISHILHYGSACRQKHC